MKSKISILLAEDHLVVRQGIRKLLEAEADFAVVGESGNGREAVELVTNLKPDVVVMDIAMPLLNGLQACKQLVAKGSTCRVLILSAHSEDAYMEGAIEAGASGIVLKHSPGIALAHAIREVHAGRLFFSSAIIRRYRDAYALPCEKESPGKRPPLTPRETEVLQLIAEGLANKETAAELKISIKTVEKHRTNLMRKLNIHDTATLTRYAIGEGIIESRIQKTND